MKTKRAGLAGSLAPALLALTLSAHGADGQDVARVNVAEENFRKDPNGTPLATVVRNAQLTLIRESGNWAEVTLEGWVWAPSIAATDREGFDLRVSAEGGENLRATPQGTVVARLLEGCLLDRVSVQGNWVRVRRQGWLWKPSLEVSGAAPAAGGAGDTGAASPPTRAPAPASSDDEQALITARSPLVIYATPDGDTVAQFRPGAQAQVLGRTGDWIRVRVDGWVYGPAALDSAPDVADTGDITPAQLRADPGGFKGALVRWRVQVISLRRAERARTDFAEGEPFIQGRVPGDAGFVYLAVPEGLLAVAERLEGLEYVTVVGRVRTGRSSLLGSPVVDLTDIERVAPG